MCFQIVVSGREVSRIGPADRRLEAPCENVALYDVDFGDSAAMVEICW